MGKLLEQLKEYFDNTTDEVLEREAAKYEELNNIAHDLFETDVIEYAKKVRGSLPDSDDNV